MARQLLQAREVERMRERGDSGYVVFLRIAPGDNMYLPLDNETHGHPKSWVWVHTSLADAIETIRSSYGRALDQDRLFVRSLDGDVVWRGWNPGDARVLTYVGTEEFRRRASRRLRRKPRTQSRDARSRRRS